MYCPKCLSDSLTPDEKVIIHILINNKRMNTGQFAHNFENEKKDQCTVKLKEKLEQYFKWYSGFANKDPITSFQLYTADFTCENGCKIPVGVKFSLIGEYYSNSEIENIVQEFCQRYDLEQDLEFD